MVKTVRLLLCLLFLAQPALAEKPQVTGCETVANVQGICGFPAPEDIDLLPDGQHLLLSPYGGLSGEHPLPFYVFNMLTKEVAPIEIGHNLTDSFWGEASCTEPATKPIGAHGIHISKRNNQQWQLLAVNHVRESIEFFEIQSDKSRPKLIWRGCVVAPAKSSLNDVTALPDGGFLVTHMVERGSMGIMEAMSATSNTGYVLRWQPAQGFDKLPGSDAIIPNGVALSKDGDAVFISETGGQRIRKIDYNSGKVLNSIKLGPTDNLSWSAEGNLIATVISGEMPEDCFSSPGPCLAPFNVISINPLTMDVTTLHRQNGPPMGAASVAVRLGDQLYVGTFRGQQMMHVKLPAQHSK